MLLLRYLCSFSVFVVVIVRVAVVVVVVSVVFVVFVVVVRIAVIVTFIPVAAITGAVVIITIVDAVVINSTKDEPILHQNVDKSNNKSICRPSKILNSDIDRYRRVEIIPQLNRSICVLNVLKYINIA